jgi:hypothetical protein
MALVDLRLRDVEPVQDGAIPLGWEENGDVVARIAVERNGRKLVVRDVQGAAEPLIDALADVATDADAIVDCDGVVLRRLSPEAAPPEETAAFSLGDIEAAVRAAWSRETAEDPDLWSDDNPASEHCGVTALVVRELLGGEILIAGTVRDGRRVARHAWNLLPSGLQLDLTREQFRSGEEFEKPVVGEPLVSARYPERFELFRRRVLDRLSPQVPC